MLALGFGKVMRYLLTLALWLLPDEWGAWGPVAGHIVVIVRVVGIAFAVVSALGAAVCWMTAVQCLHGRDSGRWWATALTACSARQRRDRRGGQTERAHLVVNADWPVVKARGLQRRTHLDRYSLSLGGDLSRVGLRSSRARLQRGGLSFLDSAGAEGVERAAGDVVLNAERRHAAARRVTYDDDLLLDIEVGVIAYLYRGRNAWHSTWVQHRFENTQLFSDVTSAKFGAESLRERGNEVFSPGWGVRVTLIA